MQEERNADGTASDDQINGHINRLTGQGGPFEILPAGDEPAAFRRGPRDLQSLFKRVKMLHQRVQLRHVREFSFGDVARGSRELSGPTRSKTRYLGIRDDDPFTWMTEFMFAISNGNIAVPISGGHHINAFRHHTGQTLVVDQLARRPPSCPDLSAVRHEASQNGSDDEGCPRRPAIALFTSGTSGIPKPVFHSHESVLSGLNNMLLAASISAFSARLSTSSENPTASLLLMCPWSYIAGTAQFFLSFVSGNSIVVPADRSANGLASTIERNRITSIVGIRRDELERLIAVPAIEQLASSIRSIHVYGETLPAEQIDRLRTVFPHAKVGQGYGMTESFGPIAAFVREDADGPLFWKLPSVEAAVLHGTQLRPYGSGRLHIRGRNMMLGYGPPQDLASSFDWFDTGDEVELFSSGKMRILDRSSRVLQFGDAQRVYLAEIEKSALQAKARDAAAWISAEPGPPVVYLAIVPTTEVKSDIGSTLTAKFGIELRILHVSAIPRLHGGKIDREELTKARSLRAVCRQ